MQVGGRRGLRHTPLVTLCVALGPSRTALVSLPGTLCLETLVGGDPVCRHWPHVPFVVTLV